MDRYSDFFDLFDDFAGYIEFYHLQDLVAVDGTIHFYLPFDDFNTSAFPTSLEEYWQYRDRTLEFLHGRNRRIADWASRHLN